MMPVTFPNGHDMATCFDTECVTCNAALDAEINALASGVGAMRHEGRRTTASYCECGHSYGFHDLGVCAGTECPCMVFRGGF